MSATKLRKLLRRDRAEVGVGTLIIFIAMVLVAAVAAAVIIGTSGSLQQRAQATGKEATQEVASNLKVINVYGERATASDDIGTVRIFLSLAAGAQPVALEDLLVRYSDGDAVIIYKLADATNPFTLSYIRGSDSNNVIETGDLVELSIDLASDLPPRSDFSLQLIPVTGAPQELEITTPPTYGSDLYITL